MKQSIQTKQLDLIFWTVLTYFVNCFGQPIIIKEDKQLSPNRNIDKPHPQKFPLFSDLEEGFEKEIEFVKENVLLPFANQELYEADGILSLPRGLYFKGEGAAELVVHALANEGDFNITEIEASESLAGLHIYPEKRTELENIFEKLEKNSPSILLIHGGFFSQSKTKEEVKILLKMMENISGKILVIQIISAKTRFSEFPLFYDFLDAGLGPEKRKTILKLATRNWKHPPTPQIIKKVASCEKLDSTKEIESLAYSVYDNVMKQQLKKLHNETVAMEINPSLYDWLWVMDKKFGLECSVQGYQKTVAIGQKAKVNEPKPEIDEKNLILINSIPKLMK